MYLISILTIRVITESHYMPCKEETFKLRISSSSSYQLQKI